MENKHWWIIGIVALILILLVIVVGTNPPVLVQGAGPQTGNAQGLGYGQAQPYGPGTGVASLTLLARTDMTPLTGTEIADILFMREEEQLAFDAYTRWAGKYPVPVFSNIADSERTHYSEVQLLIGRYDLSGHRIGNASSGYTSPVIQSLYDTLSMQGDTSQTAAFEAGLAIEERDIADLDRTAANTTRADILQVYANLRQGSVNHKSAFLRQLGR